ncbi:MAG: nucleotidyltransferase family protein [Clostridiales bacterium]|nr:nucleotidyltransferase family protein [Clostridiales bacterium]
MHVAGMICEYNPIHLGHTYLMQQVRAQLGADTALVCCMSGNFVQRGAFAVMNKHARAEAALRCGADLVLELPLPWAVSSAENFARGGVQLLCATGVVTDLAFGSEAGSIEPLAEVRDVLLSPDFDALIQEKLTAGVSYPKARRQAAAEKLGAAAALLDEPNNILAVEYLKALYREKSAVCPMTVRRFGAAHDGSAAAETASASYLRNLLQKGEIGAAYMPPAGKMILEREMQAGRAPAFAQSCERAVMARLRTMTEEEFAAYDIGGEGLYHRFYQMSRETVSLETMLMEIKTKRYTHAALRRMLLRIYLHLPMTDLPARPPYLRLLGTNERGRTLLKEMKEAASLPILTKPADVRLLSREAQRCFAAEARSTDLYVLAYPALKESVGRTEWTVNPVIL